MGTWTKKTDSEGKSFVDNPDFEEGNPFYKEHLENLEKMETRREQRMTELEQVHQDNKDKAIAEKADSVSRKAEIALAKAAIQAS